MIGILMLDGPPFDVPGCLGSNATFPFPVTRRVVKGATPEKMTSGSRELQGSMIETARELEKEGVCAIIGHCGFMALFQKDLQKTVKIPVFTSSLLFIPLVARMIHMGRRIGILTARASYLSEEHFQAAGWSSSEILIAIGGVDHKSAWELFRTPQHPFHAEALENQLMDVSTELLRNYDDLGALVLECTAMVPFAHKIQAETGLPVFDITMGASLITQGFSRKPFGICMQPAEFS